MGFITVILGIMMVDTVIFTAKWKAVKCPDLKQWKNKLNEYVIMAKLTYFIRNRLGSKFQEKLTSPSYIAKVKIKTKFREC